MPLLALLLLNVPSVLMLRTLFALDGFGERRTDGVELTAPGFMITPPERRYHHR